MTFLFPVIVALTSATASWLGEATMVEDTLYLYTESSSYFKFILCILCYRKRHLNIIQVTRILS